jgi:hypothetical protein
VRLLTRPPARRRWAGHIFAGASNSAPRLAHRLRRRRYNIEVQSNQQNPIYLRDRVVAFLQQYQHEFKCDTEKGIVNFNDTRDSAHDGYARRG